MDGRLAETGERGALPAWVTAADPRRRLHRAAPDHPRRCTRRLALRGPLGQAGVLIALSRREGAYAPTTRQRLVREAADVAGLALARLAGEGASREARQLVERRERLDATPIATGDVLLQVRSEAALLHETCQRLSGRALFTAVWPGCPIPPPTGSASWPPPGRVPNPCSSCPWPSPAARPGPAPPPVPGGQVAFSWTMTSGRPGRWGPGRRSSTGGSGGRARPCRCGAAAGPGELSA
ncbi:MAG: hypothetical protein OWV35_00580 [Firmicutes bacterium]|nr:hypothetical protein [Bacillota bacterium]